MLPEVDKDQLAGTVSETTSSDSYIERAAATLKGEVYGLNGQVVDIGQAEIFKPHKMGLDQVKSDAESSVSLIKPGRGMQKLTHKHSAFGSRIVQRRQLKKAA